MIHIFPETRVLGLSEGEKNYDANCLRFDTIPECDGQTDGRTDGQTDISALAIPALA